MPILKMLQEPGSLKYDTNCFLSQPLGIITANLSLEKHSLALTFWYRVWSGRRLGSSRARRPQQARGEDLFCYSRPLPVQS